MNAAKFVVQSLVTRTFVAGFAEPDGRKFPITGPVQCTYPLWSRDEALALPVTTDLLDKMARSGHSVEVVEVGPFVVRMGDPR